MKQINEPEQWKGYSFEELYVRRAEIFARKEIEKYRLGLCLDNMKQSTPLLGIASNSGRRSSWFTYLEYALVAFRVARRVMPLFRKKKQSALCLLLPK